MLRLFNSNPTILALLIFFKETNPSAFVLENVTDSFNKMIRIKWIVPLRVNYRNIFYLNIEQVTKNSVKAG